MLSKLLGPLARPMVIVAMGALFGLLIAVSRALAAPFDSDQSPALLGLIAGTGAVLLLGLASLVFDVLAWFADDGDEEPSGRE